MTRTTRKRLALAAGPAAAYVTLMALVAVFVVKPPPLGWLGFAIVAAVGVGLIFAAFALFPGSQANVDPVPVDRRRDAVLILADTTCTPGQLRQTITRQLHGREVEVHVVAPILAQPVRFFTNAEEPDRLEAERRLNEALEELRAAGVEATGSVGTSDDPLQAIGDALVTFPANELVIVSSSDRRWQEDGLAERAQPLVGTVTEIVVAPQTPVQ